MELLFNSLMASCVLLLFLSNSIAYCRDTVRESRHKFQILKDSHPKSVDELPETVTVLLGPEGRKIFKRMAQFNILAKINRFPFESERAEEPRDPTTTTTLQTKRKRKNLPTPVDERETSPEIPLDKHEQEGNRETENIISKEQNENMQELTTASVGIDLHSQAVTTTIVEQKTEPENQSTEETTTPTTPYISQSTSTTAASTHKALSSTKRQTTFPSTSALPQLDTSVAPDDTNISKCVDVDCRNYSTDYDIKVKPRRLKVMVGRSVQLECQVSSEHTTSLFTVLWFKKNETHDSRSKHLGSGNWTLAIESTKLWHSGTYYCVLQPRDGCCFVKREGVGELGVYEMPNYYKHLLYITALGAFLLCICIPTVVFNYKKVKKMDAETESPDDKETVWLL